MAIRYDGRQILLNNASLYRSVFNERGVRFIRQYNTPTMKYPTSEEIQELETIGHIWSQGDKFFKLAHSYYGDASLWWVIAWYNKKPTESHVAIGDTVYIPTPLSKILRFLDI